MKRLTTAEARKQTRLLKRLEGARITSEPTCIQEPVEQAQSLDRSKLSKDQAQLVSQIEQMFEGLTPEQKLRAFALIDRMQYWNPMVLRQDPTYTCGYFAKRRSGKTNALKNNLMVVADLFDRVVLMTKSRPDPYKDIIPPADIYFKLDLAVIEEMLTANDKRRLEGKKDEKMLLILDDILGNDGEDAEDVIMRQLEAVFTRGRHKGITLWYTTQNVRSRMFPPWARVNTDICFVWYHPSFRDTETIVETWLAADRTRFKDAVSLLLWATDPHINPYQALVIENFHSSMNLFNYCFLWKAIKDSELPSFRTAKKFYWDRNPYKPDGDKARTLFGVDWQKLREWWDWNPWKGF